MKNTESLKNIVYISLPENMQSLKNLPVDPGILLPVEIDPDSGYDNLSNLSWEMIIAAMLKILAHDPGHSDAGYFRKLILAIRPGIDAEMTNAAIAKAGEKDFDIAEEIFLSLKHLFPGSVSALLNLSLLYEERADSYSAVGKNRLADEFNEKAFESYKELMETDGESADAHFNFGLFYLKRGNVTKAYEHLQSFTESTDDSKKKKKVEEIISQIESKRNTDELFYSAYDSIKMGKEEEAIVTIKQFIENEPGVWNAWFLLGWAYRRKEQYAKGLEAFEKALSLGSDQTDLFNEMAICLMELDRLDESREYLLQALKAEPENIKILSNLGIVAMKSDKTAEAERYFRTVLSISPDDQIAAEYLSRLDA